MIIRCLNDLRNGKGSQDRSEAVTRSDKARGQSTPVRKPLRHMTDGADVDDAGPNSSQHAICKVEPGNRGRASGQCPT